MKATEGARQGEGKKAERIQKESKWGKRRKKDKE